MKIKTGIYNGVFVVTCDGTRLDASFAQNFFSSMRSFIQNGHTDIILELSHVKFIDSTGLGAIVRCLKEIDNRGHLVLCGVSENVLSLLVMTHLDAVFLSASSLVSAFELLKAEKEKTVELQAQQEADIEKPHGIDASLLNSLSMEDGEEILEVDTRERRRHRRVAHEYIISNDIIVHITNKGTGKRSAAIILNISAGGLLAVSPSNLAVGDTFFMEGRIGKNFKLQESAVIRNSRGGKYGFEFIDPSSQTTAFLQQMTGAVVLDRKLRE
ncbi:MAG: hypothetical protein DSY80_05050 [Desulfocapsa sp.]|nr:MAG: hypothetical protein DSY80_05050 [Desulfocapsa sp.]